MRTNRLVTVSLILAAIAVGVTAYAQMVMRPYRNGSLWSIAFIRMKPGMETAYLNYLTTDWKRGQEAAKQEGIILSYKVLSTESHGGNDWNLLLLTEYKDLATMEANEAKSDTLTQRVIGPDEKQRQGYRDRSEIREVVGDRLAREIILEPRKQ